MTYQKCYLYPYYNMNKNSGSHISFHILKLAFALLMVGQTAFAQICVRYSGSACDECGNNYDLVNGECVSISAVSIASTPTLIFQDTAGSQKMLYRVNPVLVLIESGSSIKESEQNVVSQFEVSKPALPNVGNYYVVNTNRVVLNNYNISFPNSSILTEISPTNLTLAKLTHNEQEQQLNLTKISENGPASLTQIKQSFTYTKINSQGIEPARVEQAYPNLTLINQLQPVPSTNNTNQGQSIAFKNNQQSNDSSTLNLTIIANNINNKDLFFQLQQINQQLTQAKQRNNIDSLTLVKLNQPSNPSLPQDQSSSNVTNDLKLTEIGQKLTFINQGLIEAQLKPNPASPKDQSTAHDSLQYSKIKQKLLLNLSNYSLPSQNSSQIINASREDANLKWIKATRYELYNLTFIPQVSQAKLQQSTNNLTTFTFQCTYKVSLFQPPSSSSTGAELAYALYSRRLTAAITTKYKQFTISDRSTLCFDPPFHQSFKYLTNKYKQILNDAPLFAAYYQFCGFGKTFRIFFIDDTKYPRIVIRQGVVIVDLFRMMPAEVLFQKYEEIILT